MGYPRILPDEAAKLAFTDASKNMSDLKVRQWQATYFSVVALVAVATFSNGHETGHWPRNLTVFAGLIVIGYGAVMWRCNVNLGEFRKRLRKVRDEWISAEAEKLFYIVDEGTIEGIACGWVVVAFLFVLVVIWKWFLP